MEVKPIRLSRPFFCFQRRQIAKSVSATGQKKIRSIANWPTFDEWLTKIIADQISKWPIIYAPASPRKIFPAGKLKRYCNA